MLILPEKLLLLSYLEQKGRMSFNALGIVSYCLAGTVLLELFRRGKIKLEKNKIYIADETSTGDGLLDDALSTMKDKGGSRNVRYWIRLLSRRLKRNLFDRLEDKGIYRVEEKKFLLLFQRNTYVLVNPDIKQKILDRTRECLLGNIVKWEAEDILLLYMMKACGISSMYFAPDEKGFAAKRLKEIMKDDNFGKSVCGEELFPALKEVARAVREIQAAQTAAAASAGV